jgi:phosphohistidine phosphatase SixA
VRHAEKETGGENDPQLTAAGLQRARALADLLSRETVTHLFATEYRRTRDTLVPLAKKAGVEITVVPAREPQRLLEKLAALPAGSLAVVAGHSNTIPGLVEALSTPATHEDAAPAVEPIREDEHDRLYIVIRPALPSSPGHGGSPTSGTGQGSAAVRVLRLSYGAGSP